MSYPLQAMLNEESPLLRAFAFVGQADKKSGRGLKQKDQIQVGDLPQMKILPYHSTAIYKKFVTSLCS